MSTQPVELRIVIDDEGVRVLKQTGSGLDEVDRKSRKATGVLRTGFDAVHGAISKVHRAVFSLQGALVAVGVTLTVGGIIRGARALIEPVRQIEKMTVAFKVLTGSMAAAKQRLAELVQFARATPFELPDIFQASRTLRVFGIDTTNNMRLLGDAAAAAQVPIQELALWFGRLSAGDFGEALERMRQMGVAIKKDFEGQGLKFDKQGSLQASASQAMTALANIVDGKFKGMMEDQSKTLDGMLSNFSDFVFQAKVKLGEPLARAFKGALGGILEQFDALSASGKLEEWGERLAKVAQGAVGALARVADFVVDTVAPALKEAWDWLKDLPEKIGAIDLDAKGQNFGDAIGRGILKALTPSGASKVGAFLGLGIGQKRAGEDAMRLGNPLLPLGGLPSKQAMADATEAGVVAGMEKEKGRIAKALAEAMAAGSLAGAGVAAGGTPTAGQRELRAPGVGIAPVQGFGQFGRSQRQGIGFSAGAAGANLRGDTDLAAMMLATNEAAAQSQQYQQEWKENWLQTLSGVQEGFLNFTTGLVDVWQDWWVGLSDASLSGSERLARVWEGLKRMTLGVIGEMVGKWIKGRLFMSAADKAYAAAHTATTATTVANTTAATGALQGQAAAGIAASNSVLGPFAILTIGALVGFMLAQVASAKRSRSQGGYVVGPGSSSSDSNLVSMSSGEVAIPAHSARQLGGPQVMSDLVAGRLPGGGGVTLAPVFNISGGDPQNIQRLVEDQVLPALEDLVRRNKTALDVQVRRPGRSR